MGMTCFADRGVIRISGPDADAFLQNLLTCDIAAITGEQAAFGALLTPQGKILFDFFAHRTDGGFLFDIASKRLGDFMKRLSFYRLRSKLTIDDLSDTYAVAAGWDGEPLPEQYLAASPDPRLSALGWRAIIARDNAAVGLADEAYHARRIDLSIPEGGSDYAFEDTFPHEADMDQLNGVSFGKGCYIGQEIVSRMQHRGTARTRIVGVLFSGPVQPAPGTSVTAGGKIIGKTGSAAAGKLIAMVRIDKLQDAVTAGETILAGDIILSLYKPEWATFDFPGAREKPV